MSAVCKLAIFCLALLAAGTMAQLPDAPATANDAGAFGVQRWDVAGPKKVFIGKHVEQHMNQRFCAIWFENDDGFLFGYQTRDGALRAVARPEAR